MNDHNVKTRGAGQPRPESVFVVRFREPSPPGGPTGRVECVATGERASFDSTDGLMTFLLHRLGGGEAEKDRDP